MVDTTDRFHAISDQKAFSSQVRVGIGSPDEQHRQVTVVECVPEEESLDVWGACFDVADLVFEAWQSFFELTRRRSDSNHLDPLAGVWCCAGLHRGFSFRSETKLF